MKAESGDNADSGRQKRITNLTSRSTQLFEQVKSLPEQDSRKKWLLERVNDLSSRVNFWRNYLSELKKRGLRPPSEEHHSWDEEVRTLDVELSNVEPLLPAEPEESLDAPRLPTRWRDVEPEVIYLTAAGSTLRFGKKQIKLAKRYDPRNKHLIAISNGRVASKGEDGLVPSQESGYELKSKALSSGTGHHRFHAYYDGEVLYFPGKHTNDKY